jgi:hypothetical protein
VLGTGIAAFWGSPDATNVYAAVKWQATSAHSGYLETLLELGGVGLTLQLINLFLGIRNAFVVMSGGQAYRVRFAFVFLFTLLILNFTVPIIHNWNGIGFLLILVSLFRLQESATKYCRDTVEFIPQVGSSA